MYICKLLSLYSDLSWFLNPIMARLINVLLFYMLLVIFSTAKGESIISGTPPSSAAPAPSFYPGFPIPATPPNSQAARAHRGVRAAYWASFTGFPASSIETSYFTHIYYASYYPTLLLTSSM
ncbi:hypothetical protein HS088_TW04G00087 [Tripterygium wilfordii]|uniref:Uncharacterized protein n=1 Tax=Tripterygium wilfordii TaxID=458696 RepID=A0A7J7DPA1_TRIWF|nr:hypothetical protein HS088_TW04G00087 [Tripterygium wilfordii]